MNDDDWDMLRMKLVSANHTPEQIKAILANYRDPDRRTRLVADWWTDSFSTRFDVGHLPFPGDALYGHRFKLMYEQPDGIWAEWQR